MLPGLVLVLPVVLVLGCDWEEGASPLPASDAAETSDSPDGGVSFDGEDVQNEPFADVLDSSAEQPGDAGLPETLPDVQGDGEGGVSVCGTASGELPEGLVELGWDDGEGATILRDQDWTITVNGTEYVLNENPVWEAVRFDLEQPVLVHGFSVQWAALPEGTDPEAEIVLGLYEDFGYNGFDYWVPEPLWTGTRCAEDIVPGAWLTYVLPSPIEVAHPGLVYVAHRVEPSEGPMILFDASESPSGACDAWDECHSAINLPEAETSAFYNGVSFPFQYDYMVKLHVEPTESIEHSERIFQPVELDPAAHVSFGDYDNDGWDDVIVDGPRLYRNDEGTFVEATASSGISAMGLSATGGVFGDYDNDGCLDLLLYAESYVQADSLLKSNCDGTFSDVTSMSGIVDTQTYEDCGNADNVRSPTAAAAFFDIDADGYLDIYFANFICWEKETYYKDTVFHNLGNGTFEDWSSEHGFSALKTPSRGANPVDFDADGDVDLLVNNYRLKANLLFVNLGDGTVDEMGKVYKVAGEVTSLYYGHTIGTAWGDLDGDGDFDVIEANLAHPRFFDISDKTQVLMQQADGFFKDISGDWSRPQSAAGLRYQETHSVPSLGDFDQDGVLDLVITAVYDGRPTDFYWGNGDGTFRLDAYHAGITTENGWGMSLADIDHDGDLDVFAHQPFRNELGTESKGHWLQVRVLGGEGVNWAALGSTVRVHAGDRVMVRHVQGGTGQGGQDSMYLHFGLGELGSVDSIEVTYPGGTTNSFEGPFEVDRRLWLLGDGTVQEGWRLGPANWSTGNGEWGMGNVQTKRNWPMRNSEPGMGNDRDMTPAR